MVFRVAGLVERCQQESNRRPVRWDHQDEFLLENTIPFQLQPAVCHRRDERFSGLGVETPIYRTEQVKTSFDRHSRNAPGAVAVPVSVKVSEIVYPFQQFGV